MQQPFMTPFMHALLCKQLASGRQSSLGRQSIISTSNAGQLLRPNPVQMTLNFTPSTRDHYLNEREVDGGSGGTVGT